jgi:formamidase
MKIPTVISIDLYKPATQQTVPLHNRWHPDIPAVVHVKPGQVFRVECLDWTGGQIANNDSAQDVKDVDLNQVHYLSGPIAVHGAQPGDMLVVDILDVGPFPDVSWGFTGIFARENGGGFLTEHFPQAAKAIWDFQGIYATSRHIPRVKFAGIIHPGLIGCAPSHELLAQWNARESLLIETGGERVPPLALLPNAQGALLGTVPEVDKKQIAAHAARTVPPREHGGNCDIKNITRGSRIYFPVYVPGANLSVGDLHFSQGDGEISFCGGIEMAGWIMLKVDIIKQGMQRYHVQSPLFKTSVLEPNYTNYLAFEGISVDEQGKQYYLDAHVAYRRACLQAIDYLAQFGYTREQAYILLSAAPVEGRMSGIVDIPNACCTLAIPTDIFEFDIYPGHSGPANMISDY